jgi:hypothetical protein
MCLTITISSFQHTKPARFLTPLSFWRGVGGKATGEHTFPAPDNTRHHVTIAVSIGYALLIDNALCRGREVRPYGIETIFYSSYLVEGYWRAGIAFYATDALALLIVTAEALGDDFRGYQNTSDF